MRNIKLTISYDGTRYKGWQIQKNGNTVQKEISKAAKKIFNSNHTVVGSSRTDSGVHAKGQVANIKTSSDIPAEKITLAFNRILPKDIAIVKCEEVDLDFHSQFLAKSKHYSYKILNSRGKDPFSEKYSWKVPYKLNIAAMKREAKVLEGRHDFKSFQAKDRKDKNTVREIYSISINKRGPLVNIDIKGNGFLYNMVRNIVGTLVDTGRGYLPEGSMEKILKNKDRRTAGPTAPPKGLFLLNIKY